VIKIIILILGAVGFCYSLVRKPEYIAVLLFTIVLAQIEITFIRPIITLALFGRIIIDKKTQARYPAFMSLPYVKLLIVFLTYGLFISLSQDLFSYDLLKGAIDSVMLSYCVYHFYFKSQGADQLKTALIISGLICFADLAYTYVVFGSFPIHRLYNLFIGLSDEAGDDDIFSGQNWNFFGQICGMCFVFVFRDYVRNRSANKLALVVMPLMLIGVILSTSRSSIMALLLVSVLIVLNGINYNDQKRRLAKIGVFIAGAGFIGFLLFATVGRYVNLDTKFIDEVSFRLTQEPIAILKRAMGQSYNINNLGAMDWREESAENAYAAYMNMDFKDQLFGIGVYGFEKRDLGHGLNAHNATLLLLIEYGILGFAMFFIIIGGVVIQSIRYKNFSPSMMVIIFIMIFGLGQNREWFSWTMFLFVYCVVAEVQLIRLRKKAHQITISQKKPLIIWEAGYDQNSQDK
jgi:oligosaccharide repeat unit polymerase